MADCPACGVVGSALRHRVDQPGGFGLERCPACRLVYAVPRPTSQDLDAFYTRAYFSGGGDGCGYTDYAGGSWAEANAARTWSVITSWEPALLAARPRRVLDVGSATGAMLRSAADTGWQVLGVERSAWARDRAAESGVDSVRDLADVPADRPFGLVTMFHVLEHLIDPREALGQVRGLVAAEGAVVVEVPQWHSLGRLVRRGRWSQLRPPEHINFFTVGSLRALAGSCGLRMVRADTPYVHWHDRWGAATGGDRWALAAPVAAAVLAERLRLGGYLRAVLRPA